MPVLVSIIYVGEDKVRRDYARSDAMLPESALAQWREWLENTEQKTITTLTEKGKPFLIVKSQIQSVSAEYVEAYGG